MNSQTNTTFLICSSCLKPLKKSVMIICAECEDIILCSDCLSCGCEPGSHKKNHSYHIFDDRKSCVYQEGWSVSEEEQFLDILYSKGFGNWDIFSQMMITKTTEECYKHYEQVYDRSQTNYLPSENFQVIQRKTDNKSNSNNGSSSTNKKLSRRERRRLEVLKLRRERQQRKQGRSNPQQNPYHKNPLSHQKTSFGDVSGFMPKRKDFEMEYDNDSEKITRNMGFTDNKISWPLKYQLLRGLNERLEERNRRKEIVINMGLSYPKKLKIKSYDQIEKISQKEKKFRKNFRKFIRCFDNLQSFETTQQSLFDEFKLKIEIQRLSEWRSFGIKSIENGKKFEIQKKQFLKDNLNPRKRSLYYQNNLNINISTNMNTNTGMGLGENNIGNNLALMKSLPPIKHNIKPLPPNPFQRDSRLKNIKKKSRPNHQKYSKSMLTNQKLLNFQSKFRKKTTKKQNNTMEKQKADFFRNLLRKKRVF
ncbi:transcriptional adapter 2-alpha [Anaeramoeba flamelloides]|uniref:Transcriptional adapter 2-alpha n=1 Tax=Anaeramoeba flamelloides TaxID=1746091 RepID=A0AAV8A5R8_9EUKA|nr:transcriptional adapter 2-alpha [Anaeramoeba flamelloides]